MSCLFSKGCIGINTCLDPGKHIKRILIPYKENQTSMGHGPWVIECPGKTCVLYGLFLVIGTPIHNLSNGIFEVQLLKPAPHKTVSKRNLKNNNSLLKLTLFTNLMVLVPCYVFWRRTTDLRCCLGHYSFKNPDSIINIWDTPKWIPFHQLYRTLAHQGRTMHHVWQLFLKFLHPSESLIAPQKHLRWKLLVFSV